MVLILKLKNLICTLCLSSISLIAAGFGNLPSDIPDDGSRSINLGHVSSGNELKRAFQEQTMIHFTNLWRSVAFDFISSNMKYNQANLHNVNFPGKFCLINGVDIPLIIVPNDDPSLGKLKDKINYLTIGSKELIEYHLLKLPLIQETCFNSFKKAYNTRDKESLIWWVSRRSPNF